MLDILGFIVAVGFLYAVAITYFIKGWHGGMVRISDDVERYGN